MNKFVKRYPYAFAGLAAGIVLFVLASALNLDVFEELVALIHRGEAYELDEFIIPLILLAIGICCDFVSISLATKKEQEKLGIYNQMNEEVMNEISLHLTKLLEFRTALMKDAPKAHDVRHELDRMIVTSFNHYERAQRRGDIDSSLMSLVVNPDEASQASSFQVSQPASPSVSKPI
jgi:hypothetical protein